MKFEQLIELQNKYMLLGATNTFLLTDEDVNSGALVVINGSDVTLIIAEEVKDFLSKLKVQFIRCVSSSMYNKNTTKNIIVGNYKYSINNLVIIGGEGLTSCLGFDFMSAVTIDMTAFNFVSLESTEKMFEYIEAEKVLVGKKSLPKLKKVIRMFAFSRISELDLSGFDLSHVTSTAYMFDDMESHKIKLNDIDTSNITNMNGMFEHVSVDELDLSMFDTRKVKSMVDMFNGCAIHNKLNLNSFVLNDCSIYRIFENIHIKNLDLIKAKDSNLLNSIKSLHEVTDKPRLAWLKTFTY